MSEGVQLGQKVPEFELNTYDPAEDKFGKFCLTDQIARKRWTILFFYPADFTFVCATEFAALAEKTEPRERRTHAGLWFLGFSALVLAAVLFLR